MAGLSLKHVYKVYEGGVKAVNDFSMDIEDREFIVFVGPSGCGKSTTLRMIAGLEEITAGELQIDGVTVNGLEPKDRNIAMVFQNYALYPHMSVYDNLAFSLKIAKLPNDEIYKKVTEAAEILGITEYLDRKPKALSGGQRQRVALGRAIVRHPKVFLLDEPLSNLDAKLRAAMRAEISRLHRKLATTFIYVTHDQVEAMTMGTRIVVMKGGFIQQIDTPQNLYKYPENMFVAGFIGTPQMNFFNGTVKKEGDMAFFNLDCGVELSVPYRLLSKIHLKYMGGNYPIVLGIRPDDIKLAKDGENSENVIKGNVTAVEALGGESLIYANINLKYHENKDGALVLKADGDCSVKAGDVVDLKINLQKLHVFDRKTEMSINPRIPDVNILPCKIEKGRLIFADNELPLPPSLAKAVDGEGEMILPSNAFSLGSGSCKAIIEEVEKVENRHLYRLKTKNSDLFAVQNEANEVNSPGKEIFFDIDLSRIEIGTCNVKPLDRQNQLVGTLVKQKAKTAEGKNNYVFYIQTQGQRLVCPDFICKKLFDCRGTKIFGTQLEFLFPIQAVKTEKERPSAETVLQGTVTEILDYGKTQYAKVSVGSAFVTAPCKGNYIDRVFLNIDFSQVTVKDREHDIILV